MEKFVLQSIPDPAAILLVATWHIIHVLCLLPSHEIVEPSSLVGRTSGQCMPSPAGSRRYTGNFYWRAMRAYVIPSRIRQVYEIFLFLFPGKNFASEIFTNRIKHTNDERLTQTKVLYQKHIRSRFLSIYQISRNHGCRTSWSHRPRWSGNRLQLGRGKDACHTTFETYGMLTICQPGR